MGVDVKANPKDASMLGRVCQSNATCFFFSQFSGFPRLKSSIVRSPVVLALRGFRGFCNHLLSGPKWPQPRWLESTPTFRILGVKPLAAQGFGCGSKFNGRGKPQVLVHVSTCQGKPFWNSGFWSHSHLSWTTMGFQGTMLKAKALGLCGFQAVGS